ncbi:ParM/StbA family protein [Okeania sp. SIO1I7]|uniref:ParM/StbA family protein n=1 Tax=Okeania sp. SIO1I7 TaxID=2607772 RepID=UPI0013FB4AAE|nr:ParM/StbA family protein [Okeania sp. SIO1I7]NET30339.1 ParM/StbA family protein [Okeania sp. SIO1I7]
MQRYDHGVERATKASTQPTTKKKIMMTANMKNLNSSHAEQMIPDSISIGIDNGNGRIKAISSKGLTARIKSLIHYLDSEQEMTDGGNESVFVEYVSGPRTELWEQRFVVGQQAYQFNPTGVLSTSDDREGKSKYALELTLAAIAPNITMDYTNVAIALSVHDAGAFCGIKNLINGEHTIRLNGRRCKVNLQLKVVKTEGIGAYASLLKSKKCTRQAQTVLLDIGFGTIIVSVYSSGAGKQIIPFPDMGAKSLYQRISNNLSVRKQLKRTGDIQLIQKAIESGNFIYGNNKISQFSIADIYLQELRPWVKNSLLAVLGKIDSYLDSAEFLFAIGGGSQLPKISQWLEKKGFEVVDDSEFINARGLLALAKREVNK